MSRTAWVDCCTLSFVANQVRNVSDAWSREGHGALCARVHLLVCSVAHTPSR